MRVEFSAKNYKLTEAMKEFILHRLKKIERFFAEDEAVQVKVLLKTNKYRHESEVLVFDEGEWLTAKAESEEMEESVIQAIDHLQTQLKKLKKKLKERKRREAHREPEWEAPPPRPRKAGGVSVERLRRSDVPSMTLDEALRRLRRADAGFWVYRDAEDDRLRILAFGREGTVTVIDVEPQ